MLLKALEKVTGPIVVKKRICPKMFAYSNLNYKCDVSQFDITELLSY